MRPLVLANVKNIFRDDNCFWNEHHTRTGQFAELMDLAEELDARFGFKGIGVENIVNQFLPAVLEKRGYRRVGGLDMAPTYWKDLGTG